MLAAASKAALRKLRRYCSIANDLWNEKIHNVTVGRQLFHIFVQTLDNIVKRPFI